MMTYGNIANVATTAALTGAQAGLLSPVMPMNRSEAQAMAIGKVAEMNIIQPKTKNDQPGLLNQNQDRNQIGLNRQDYNALGQAGLMTAMTRAGGGLLQSGLISNTAV
jgi:hypothetical protein